MFIRISGTHIVNSDYLTGISLWRRDIKGRMPAQVPANAPCCALLHWDGRDESVLTYGSLRHCRDALNRFMDELAAGETVVDLREALKPETL